MSGRSAVVTGGNTGIGRATAQQLARLGARVVITARDEEKGRRAAEEISLGAAHPVECTSLDLASLASVRSCARELLDRLDDLHVLDLNAGAVLSRRQVSCDGLEMQFQTNHLGHFLLAHLLRGRLEQSAPSRVVVLSSWGHTQARHGLDFDDLQWERRPYRGTAVYGATKLMNLYFAFELARRLGGTGVVANAMHPGFVASGFGLGGDTRWLRAGLVLARPFARSPEKGARTAVWLASSPETAEVTGGYFVDCRPAPPSPAAGDTGAARRLWDLSELLAGID